MLSFKRQSEASFRLNKLQVNVIFTTKCDVTFYCPLMPRKIISFYEDVTKILGHPSV